MSHKTVTLEVEVTLKGDYYSITEAPRVISHWLHAALEDRQDVTDWAIDATILTEDGEDVPVPSDR